MKLEIELTKVESTSLKMRITSQPQSVSRGCNEFFSSDGVILNSVAGPEMSDVFKAGMIHIWVWGVHSKSDLNEVVHNFKTAEKRDDAIYRINKCVEKFNATLNQ